MQKILFGSPVASACGLGILITAATMMHPSFASLTADLVIVGLLAAVRIVSYRDGYNRGAQSVRQGVSNGR